MKKTTSKITLSGILLAIIIVTLILKNISPFISGPIVNTVLVIASLQLGIWWGVVFSAIVPILSIVLSPASAMTMVAGLTNGITIPIIIGGNIIFVLAAYFGKKYGYKTFIVALILGAFLKWLFMWGCADLIIKPLYAEKLGDKIAVINKIFSTLQLYSGLLGIIIIYPVQKVLEKIKIF